jgi:thiamine pyrophosphate-dependent acetolactate synthase large subunit-like protein
MAGRTVSEEIVHILAEAGIRDVFGMTGDALNAFTDALRRDGRLSWITVRHEETAAFAAAAQAELSGRIACCAGTVGPGAIHLINGLYNAKRDRAPVLAITGQVPREEAGLGYFQEVDQDKLFDDVSVFSQTIRSASQMPRILHQAIDVAIAKRGVAHIAVPTDIVSEIVPAHNFSRPGAVPEAVITPSEADLDAAAEIISAGGDVALLIGSGCRGEGERVLRLAERLKAPIIHALKGTDVIPFDSAYRIGGVGHVGTPQGIRVLDKCGLLLMLGTDFPYSAFLPTHGNVVQIDREPTNLGKRCAIKLGLNGHVGPTLDGLTQRLAVRTGDAFLKSVQSRRDIWNKQMDKTASLSGTRKGLIHPQSVIRLAGDLAGDDAIFVGEVGEVTVWIGRHLRTRGNQRVIGSFNHGSLGVGLPAAIGAQTLYPDRQVIALCGDGAFGMLMADFVTASRYDLPLTVIVLDNQKLGFVELEMEASGMARYATNLVNPDFAMVAEACGGVGIDVSDPSELDGAIAKALATPKATLLNVKVNPDELILPPKIDAKAAWKFTHGKIKEVLLERDLGPITGLL